MILLAGAADIKQELRASGFIQLRDFVQFGNSRLWNRLTEAENNHRDALGEVDRNHRTALSEAENNLRTADAFDRTTAQAALDSVKTQIEAAKTAVTNKHEALVADITIQMKTVTKEFAPKTFIGEYPFTTMDVQVNGNTSSFTMVIPAGFVGAKIGEVVIPVPNVTGRSGSSARQATAPIRHQDNNEYIAFLLGDNRIFMALLSRHSNRVIIKSRDGWEIPREISRNFAEDASGAVVYARYGNPSQIALTISGNTDNIRELVRNCDDYQVRVRFTNLQHRSHTESVKYWRVSPSDFKTAIPGGQFPNPFTIEDSETVHTVSADVLKIEIVKVK